MIFPIPYCSGEPGIDYPVHSVIPKTDFNCSEQRYKGFFGDPDTGEFILILTPLKMYIYSTWPDDYAELNALKF